MRRRFPGQLTIGPVWLRSSLYDCNDGFLSGSSGFWRCLNEKEHSALELQRTQRYILNSFIKTGFCWGTACHDRADDANARFFRLRDVLLVAVRRACMVARQRWFRIQVRKESNQSKPSYLHMSFLKTDNSHTVTHDLSNGFLLSRELLRCPYHLIFEGNESTWISLKLESACESKTTPGKSRPTCLCQ